MKILLNCLFFGFVIVHDCLLQLVCDGYNQRLFNHTQSLIQVTENMQLIIIFVIYYYL